MSATETIKCLPCTQICIFQSISLDLIAPSDVTISDTTTDLWLGVAERLAPNISLVKTFLDRYVRDVFNQSTTVNSSWSDHFLIQTMMKSDVLISSLSR